MEKRYREGVTSQPEGKVVWKKNWERTLRTIESRKKLDERRKKLQKELRDIEKFACISKEAQSNLKERAAETIAGCGANEA